MNSILILYAEVMPYNTAAFSALISLRPDLKLDVVCWGTEKKLTPYIPEQSDGIEYFVESKTTLNDLKDLHKQRSYALVLVCGRMEKKYLQFVLYLKKLQNPPIIIGQSDEQYYGTRKQKVVKLFSKFFYRRYFDKMFVPGYFQYEYMRYIGFKKDQINIGAYTADINKFNDFYTSKTDNKKQGNTLNVLFIGRVERVKGIELLVEAISNFNKTSNREIRLKIIGIGSLIEIIQSVSFVEHHSFKNQNDLLSYLADVDFFILPSLKEPWGVVIHEMAAAGMPIICSDACGARSAFVLDNYNGFIFQSGDKDSLIKTFYKAARISADRLQLFQKRSFELSKSITPDLWAETISSFVPDSVAS